YTHQVVSLLSFLRNVLEEALRTSKTEPRSSMPLLRLHTKWHYLHAPRIAYIQYVDLHKCDNQSFYPFSQNSIKNSWPWSYPPFHKIQFQQPWIESPGSANTMFQNADRKVVEFP